MLPPRCRPSGSSNTTQRLRQRHPTPDTQHPTGGPCHPTPKIRGGHPTPKSVDTQRPISNTQRPKNFLPLRGIFLYRGCWDPAGCLGGRRRLGALVPSPLGAAAARWGAAARSGEVYQPGRRETGGGRATQRPFKRRTPGATLPRTQHPTSNTQRPPNTQHPTPNALRSQALQGTYGDYDDTVVMPSTGAFGPDIEFPAK